MITYATAMSKEANERYNHLHAEIARALTNIQIFEAGTEIRLPTTFGGKDLGGENPMYIMSQSPEIMEQNEHSLTTRGLHGHGQPPIGMAKQKQNTQIVDDQILELNVPQDNMDQFCEDTSENKVTALAETPEAPPKTSTSATGDLRDRTNPLRPATERISPTNASTDNKTMSDPIELVANDVEMAEITQKEPNTPSGADVVNKTVRTESQDDEDAQIPDPHTDEAGRKICIVCADKGHVLGTCPNKDKNEIPNLNSAQMHHLGQNNNCDYKNTTRVKARTWIN